MKKGDGRTKRGRDGETEKMEKRKGEIAEKKEEGVHKTFAHRGKRNGKEERGRM